MLKVSSRRHNSNNSKHVYPKILPDINNSMIQYLIIYSNFIEFLSSLSVVLFFLYIYISITILLSNFLNVLNQ